MRQRLFGLVFMLIGLFIAYFAIYEPYMAARNHAPKVSMSLKGAVICPLAVVTGFLYLVLGPKAEELFGTREHPTEFAWTFGILLAVLGLFLYLWLKDYLRNAGYVV